MQYLKKKVSNEVNFLHADKAWKFPANYMIFDGDAQSFQSNKFVKEVRDEVDFLHADKHQSFL